MVNVSPRDDVFVPHTFPEKQIDLGEITMNFVEAGSAENPALLLVPQQTGSWWSYEPSIALLAERFHVFAVDMRGQGRSSWTPRRYSLDNFGSDLVRFIALAIGRPTIVSGCSSGGVMAAWLAAYAMPGQIRGAICEDGPLFASELVPSFGHNVRQHEVGAMFEMWHRFLGNQWSVGDWDGFVQASAKSSVAVMAKNMFPEPAEPPQFMKEYDPEWAGAFYNGTVAVNCPHDVMLAQVKVPMLITHHMRSVDPESGVLGPGAMTDAQVRRAISLVESAGRRCDYQDHPTAMHMMHQFHPELFAKVVGAWAATLPDTPDAHRPAVPGTGRDAANL